MHRLFIVKMLLFFFFKSNECLPQGECRKLKVVRSIPNVCVLVRISLVVEWFILILLCFRRHFQKMAIMILRDECSVCVVCMYQVEELSVQNKRDV